jgi:hypothetical protein
MKRIFNKIRLFRNYYTGKMLLNNECFIDGVNKSKFEMLKRPLRTEIINFVLSQFNRETCYLEIGVRNPDDNFNHILANKKYSVDPGIEYMENPVDFKLTSDDFFYELNQNRILFSGIKFDVIFVDGLHVAEQVDRDISNSLNFIKDDGFIILHDCNPPTEWHAREEFNFNFTPAENLWNGTTWKAFMKWRFNSNVHSCCIDSDWGVGILSKNIPIGQSINTKNQFYDFSELMGSRVESLNLIDFADFKELLERHTNNR